MGNFVCQNKCQGHYHVGLVTNSFILDIVILNLETNILSMSFNAFQGYRTNKKFLLEKLIVRQKGCMKKLNAKNVMRNNVQ